MPGVVSRSSGFAQWAIGLLALLALCLLLVLWSRFDGAARAPAAGGPTVEAEPAGFSPPPEPLAEASAGPERATRFEQEPAKPTQARPRPQRLRGRVVNVRDGMESPAQGVLVALKDENGLDVELQAATGQEGEFEFSMEDIPAAATVVSIAVPGDAEHRMDRVTLRRADLLEEPDQLVLRRTAYGVLEGVVVDDRDQPLGGALVLIHRSRNQPPLEVLSGPDGTFAIYDTHQLSGAPRATLDGYRFFWSHRLEPHDDGGWHPVRVVLTRAASLLVKVLDAEGRPAEGFRLNVRIAASEKGGRSGRAEWADHRHFDGRRSWLYRRSPEDLLKRTDAEGTALFSPVWSGRRIEVLADRGEPYGAELAGELVKAGHPTARPLILAPDEIREVVLRLARRLRVEGRVSWPQGDAIPEVRVALHRLSRDGEILGEQHARTDEEGRYAGEVSDLEPGDLIQASADDGSGFASGTSSIANAGVAVADPVESREGRIVLDVILQPTLALAGRVVGAGGEPARGWVKVRPEGRPGPGDLRLLCVGPWSCTDVLRDGRFRLGGLGPGTYELLVYERLAGGESLARFPDLVAGTEDLELRIEAEADVFVRIRAEAEGVELARCVAILGSTEATDGAYLTGETRHELTSLASWPLEIPLDTSGSIASTFMRIGSEPSAHEWAGLRSGRYQVGIEAWDAEGSLLYPMASEPMELGSGRHVFTAHLRPAGSLSGEARGASGAVALAVALVDDEGVPLPLFPATGRARDVLELDGRGRFSASVAPTGTFTLLVGTEREIRSGHPLWSGPVSIAPGENEPLEIDLR